MSSIQSKCVTYRKCKAAMLNSMMADLPKQRLALGNSPLTNTGTDYFSPFYVSVKRSTENRCGLLFTCLTTSAVHFEGKPSKDTSGCVMGIEKFVFVRGIPSVIWSDNAS